MYTLVESSLCSTPHVLIYISHMVLLLNTTAIHNICMYVCMSTFHCLGFSPTLPVVLEGSL